MGRGGFECQFAYLQSQITLRGYDDIKHQTLMTWLTSFISCSSSTIDSVHSIPQPPYSEVCISKFRRGSCVALKIGIGVNRAQNDVVYDVYKLSVS
jgi:hypothetical protein